MARRSRYAVHRAIDAALPFVLAAAGLLHPEDPGLYFACLGVAFAALAGLVLGGAGIATLLAERAEARIQGPRRRPAPIAREAFETTRAIFVAACLAAWPMTQWRLGQETGMVLSLDAAGIGLGRVLAQTVLGILVLDGWLYLKHRLLHTRALFGFHKQHHAFRDPTPFAGFAVGPFEALATFWPIVLLCIPAATHWAPLYFALVLGFVALNFYLHCGVTLRWAEAILPRALFNSSAFHNVHHSHAAVNFGEAMIVWDRLLRTRLADRPDTPALPR
jgi:lathosterol oxidase